MKGFHRRRDLHRHDKTEDDVVGEILEDIECLKLDDEELERYDDLNDDTFGGGAQEVWDPTDTFKEAATERVCGRVRREPRELVKSELFDFPELELSPRRQERKPRNQTEHSHQNAAHKNRDNNANTAQQDEPEEIDRSALWETDLASFRRLGLFAITPHYIDIICSKTAHLPLRWKVSQRTLDRHAKGVRRTRDNLEKELFMSDQAFDQILRIHLTQICKDPRLQNYTGKWNARHLGMKPRSESPHEATETNSPEQKSALNPNRFGRTSCASVRHGRRLIQLNNFITKPQEGPVPKERQLRETIEFGYEALYMLCDIEEEIEQCPMNHVAALDKMQKEREGKLNQLFVSLTTGVCSIEDIMALNKGRLLMIKLGKKLSIETKIQLACCIINCTPAFTRICEEVDLLFAHEPDLKKLISLLCSSNNLIPLVAFEREDYSAYEGDGSDLQHMLYEANSYTQCFLFVLETLTLGGHLFLLPSETGGRQTALQKCCQILVSSEQECRGLSRFLHIRGGVIFVNVLFERFCQNPMAINKDLVDTVLHYMLETSEHITSHSHEWQSLAGTIMKLFR